MDLNNDGHPDILSGSYSRNEQPMAGLFQVLWGQAGGTFKKAAILNGTDRKPLIIPYSGQDNVLEGICTRPTAVDWNGDGKLDLVVGNFGGTFYLFTGEGDGKFNPKPEPIKVAGQPLKVNGAHSDPFMVDWDGDGDLDLLSGSDQGGVQWAENSAGKGNVPQLKTFKVLISQKARSGPDGLLAEKDLTAPSSSFRIWVEDVNGDGKLDILVGDNVALVSAAKGVSKDDFVKRQAKWSEAIQVASKALGNGSDRDAMKRYQDLYSSRDAFMTEERTGYIWLYLRN